MSKQILFTLLLAFLANMLFAQIGNSPPRFNDVQNLNTCDEESVELTDCDVVEPHPAFRQSVGLNYNFFDEARVTFIEDLAPNWRQFTQWHNTGSNNNELCPDGSMLNLYPWDCNIDPAPGANSFNETFTYSFTNFTGAPIPPFEDKPAVPAKINYTLNNTKSVDLFYPAFNSSIHNLSTSWYNSKNNDIEVLDEYDMYGNPITECDPSVGWANTMNIRDAIWRKPVPHWVNPLFPNDGLFLEHEDYQNPESYRFFAEYLNYYFGIMGSGDAMPTHLNYADFLYSENDGKITGVGYHNYAEIWNEPDAWWTWPNNHGYFTPEELAAFSHAAIGGIIESEEETQAVTTTIINDEINAEPPFFGITVGGIDANRDGTAIISPSPHEMDTEYMINYINALRGFPGREDFEFDALAFHHYSAYDVNRLSELFSSCPGGSEECEDEDKEWGYPTPEEIVEQSMSKSNPTTHPFDLCIDDVIDTDDDIKTVNLEASPGNSYSSYWISPELDGYYQRGVKLRSNLTAGGVSESTPIWVTEWGYNTNVSQSAKYPKGLDPSETQARWLMRGFLEYDRSIDIQNSFWHWYQDTQASSWDNTCGLVTNGGGRKASWYYLRTMMDQIGNKSFVDPPHVLEGCTDLQTPSFSILDGEVVGEPELDCPRIYKYGNDCCEETDGQGNPTGIFTDNYINNVWVTWFPSMKNKKADIDLYLGRDLGITGQPLQYYTVEPRAGIT